MSSNNTVTLTCTAIPNFRYALETTTNLAAATIWTPVSTNMAGTNEVLPLIHTTAEPRMFFRTRLSE
jgi:hypothetical protein